MIWNLTMMQNIDLGIAIVAWWLRIVLNYADGGHLDLPSLGKVNGNIPILSMGILVLDTLRKSIVRKTNLLQFFPGPTTGLLDYEGKSSLRVPAIQKAQNSALFYISLNICPPPQHSWERGVFNYPSAWLSFCLFCSVWNRFGRIYHI